MPLMGRLSSLRQSIAPAFEGKIELPGRAKAFLSDLEDRGFSPSGRTGFRANYKASRFEEGIVIEAGDNLTAWNIGLEKVALLPGRQGASSFELHYRVVFPRWHHFCWIISLCCTLVPVGFFSTIIIMAGIAFPGAYAFAKATVWTPYFLILALPIAGAGFILPPFLTAKHKAVAKAVLEKTLKARADLVANDD